MITTHRNPDMWHSGGPYSAAVKVGELIFVSGNVSVDPATGNTVEGDIEVQTRQVLANLDLTLKAAGSSLNSVVKTTVFLTDYGTVAAMNRAYRAGFPGHLPARSTVQVGPLSRPEFLIEIEAVAVVE